MSIFIDFLWAFVVGGLICTIGQLLLDFTKLTSARILVIFLLAGVVLQAFGLYEWLVELAGAGATVPLSGFGYLLAKGAMEGARQGIFEALTGCIRSAATGLTAAIVFGYLAALIFRPRSKKL